MSLSEQNQALVLKPCPFCGSGETFTRSWQGENGGSFAFARCSQCGASTQDNWPNEARAALEWNRRAEGVAALQQAGDLFAENAKKSEQAGEPVAFRIVAKGSRSGSPGVLVHSQRDADGYVLACEDHYTVTPLYASPLPQQTALVEQGVEKIIGPHEPAACGASAPSEPPRDDGDQS